MAPRTVRSSRGRVNARARFADRDREDVLNSLLAKEVAHKCIRLAGGGAVADGDGAHVVLTQHGLELWYSLGVAVLRSVKIDDIVRKQFAGLIDHGDLAAGAQSRVDA